MFVQSHPKSSAFLISSQNLMFIQSSNQLFFLDFFTELDVCTGRAERSPSSIFSLNLGLVQGHPENSPLFHHTIWCSYRGTMKVLLFLFRRRILRLFRLFLKGHLFVFNTEFDVCSGHPKRTILSISLENLMFVKSHAQGYRFLIL